MVKNTYKKKLDDFYKSSDKYLYRLMSHDEEYLGPYVSFVEKYSQSKKLILDLGCGTGKSSFLLSQLNHFVVGLDISFKFLRMNSCLCNTNLILVAGDAVKLPFGNSTFDVVASKRPEGPFRFSKVLKSFLFFGKHSICRSQFFPYVRLAILSWRYFIIP